MADSALLRGLARGLTADWVGAPVDFATQLTNLGLAGLGYTGHKLGLLETPPDLIDPATVPFSSDWLARGTPLADDRSAAYTAGRLTGNIAPGLANLAKGLAAPSMAQLNSLYPGGRRDLQLTHGTEAYSLFDYPRGGTVKDHLAYELYSPSFAIHPLDRRNNFGSLLLVPNPKRLEPRVSPTTIYPADAYVPRYSATFATSRAKPKSIFPISTNDRRELANARLLDRFFPAFEKGGIGFEGGAGPDLTGTRQLPKGQETAHVFRLRTSPRFQSFKHFESDPRGAEALFKNSDPRYISSEAVFKLKNAADGIFVDMLTPSGRTVPERLFVDGIQFHSDILRGILSNDPAVRNLLKKPDATGTLKPIDDRTFLRLRRDAMDFAQALRQSPSEYAEVKRWGPMPLTPDNFLAIISSYGYAASPANKQKLANAAMQRGIPFFDKSNLSQEELGRFIEQLQYNAVNSK